MGSKRNLVIKGWRGTSDLQLEIVDFEIRRWVYGRTTVDRVTVRRKPDQYSSRIGLMAYLNNSHGKLSWGFAGIAIRVNDFSASGAIAARREYSFSGTAVERAAADGGLEVLTFVTNQTGGFSAGSR